MSDYDKKYEQNLKDVMDALAPEELDFLMGTGEPDKIITKPDRRTAKRIRQKTWKKIHGRVPWTTAGKWLAAAACIAMVLLVWQKDTVYAGIQKLLYMIPGYGIQESDEIWYLSLVPEKNTALINGWEVTFEKGYMKRLPDAEGTSAKSPKCAVFLRFSAQRKEGTEELVSALTDMDIYLEDQRLSDGSYGGGNWRNLKEGSTGTCTIYKEKLWMEDFQPGKTYTFRWNEEDAFTFGVEELKAVELSGTGQAENSEAALAIETEFTEEGLQIDSYAYYEKENMRLIIPKPEAFSKQSYFNLYMGKEVIPYLTCGTKTYPVESVTMADQDYSEAMRMLFDVKAGDSYTLHIPYMAVEELVYNESTGRWQASPNSVFEEGDEEILMIPCLEIGDCAELNVHQKYEKAEITFTEVTRMSQEEMREMTGIAYEEDAVEGYYYALEVEEEDGWELLTLDYTVEDGGYGYIFIPVREENELKGILLVLGRNNAEKKKGNELRIKAGCPTYLYETDFVISGIMD